jgi:hypothetical protein
MSWQVCLILVSKSCVRDTHLHPVCVVVFEFTPLVHSTCPSISLSHHSLYSCPVYTLFHWDIPILIPDDLTTALHALDIIIDIKLNCFLSSLETFLEEYFHPIKPYDLPGLPLLLTSSPSPTPYQEFNLNLILLG